MKKKLVDALIKRGVSPSMAEIIAEPLELALKSKASDIGKFIGYSQNDFTCLINTLVEIRDELGK